VGCDELRAESECEGLFSGGLIRYMDMLEDVPYFESPPLHNDEMDEYHFAGIIRMDNLRLQCKYHSSLFQDRVKPINDQRSKNHEHAPTYIV
jgi:hypothetical protein